MQNAVLEKTTTKIPVRSSRVWKNQGQNIMYEKVAKINEELGNFNKVDPDFDQALNKYVDRIVKGTDIYMDYEARTNIGYVYHPDIDRKKLEKAYKYTGTITPEIVQ